MGPLHDEAAPRKRMVTYGKAVRKRIPEFNLTSAAGKRSPSEVASQRESQVPSPTPPPSASTVKPKPGQQVSGPISISPASPPTDIFDVPSDDELPKPKRKAAAQPAKQAKLISVRQRSVSRKPSPNPPSKVDVFDVPSDEEVPKLVHKSTRPPPVSHKQKLKPARQTATLKSPSTLSAANDVFDIPSSGEEAAPTPKPIQKLPTKPITSNTQASGATKTLANKAQDIGSRKRMKMSPIPEPPLRPAPNNTAIRHPPGGRPPYPPKDRNVSPATGQSMKVVDRPKLPRPLKNVQRPRTPPKESPMPEQGLATSSTSSPITDVDMMDVDPKGEYFSPRGVRMWKDLLDTADETNGELQKGIDETYLDIDSSRKIGPSKPRINILSKPAGVSKPPQRSPRRLPRRRLIDSLVEQATEEDSEEEKSDEDLSDRRSDSAPTLNPPFVTLDRSRSQSVVPEPLQPAAVISESQGSQGSGPKFTYSRQRSMLAEQDLMQELALGLPSMPSQPAQGKRGRRGSIPTLKPLASFNEEEDEDSTLTAVKSVHELRKAGANNRFIDEVHDFLERIGRPGDAKISMRRSGLLDLANKMKDKDFALKFRANGMEQKLFMHLGQETDLVAGFILVTLLIQVLLDGNMPHIIPQLRRQGVTRLLIRLLESQSNISIVGKDRKSNMSKNAQSLLIEHHDYILQIPVWEELQPRVLSSRTAALKCVELMVRQTREAGNAGDMFSKELTTSLFDILRSASEENAWDLPRDKQAIDFYLALSALESHSLTARTVQDESIWINEFLPVIADTINIGLSRPYESFGVQQTLILRLTINVTNNNPKASEVFARPALMAVMGQALVAKFKQVSGFLTEEDFFVVMDHLVLILGVMINFAEWSSTSRESLQSLEGDSSDPLNAMVQLFLDNQESTSMAESVEESQKNVAFGYLSVLLGYFCLLPSISERIRSKQAKKTLRPLLSSIEEFIGHHKTVDGLIAADEESHNPQTGLTERLESLVRKLAALNGLIA